MACLLCVCGVRGGGVVIIVMRKRLRGDGRAGRNNHTKHQGCHINKPPRCMGEWERSVACLLWVEGR
jgi:hypothetical protein